MLEFSSHSLASISDVEQFFADAPVFATFAFLSPVVALVMPLPYRAKLLQLIKNATDGWHGDAATFFARHFEVEPETWYEAWHSRRLHCSFPAYSIDWFLTPGDISHLSIAAHFFNYTCQIQWQRLVARHERLRQFERGSMDRSGARGNVVADMERNWMYNALYVRHPIEALTAPERHNMVRSGRRQGFERGS